MTTLALPRPQPSAFALGRTYLHPAIDYLVIGGGLSLILTAFIALAGTPLAGPVLVSLPLLLVLSNLAHFAASTVRLYTKPGAFEKHRFLTMALPLATVGALTLFAPMLVGLYSARPHAGHARAAAVASVVAALACLLAFRGTPAVDWLPFVAGVVVALAILGSAYLEPGP